MLRVPAAGLVGARAIREAATTELTQIMGLVRAALQARYDAAKKPGDSSYLWFDIEAMYPDRVIVCKDGRYWSFPYTIDDANQVKLQEPSEVVERFDQVKEAIDADRVIVAAGDSTGLVQLLEAVAGEAGKAWDVILLRAGESKNGVYYPDAVLKEAAALFEGARCYVKSDELHLKKDEKDVIRLFGWFANVKFVEGKTTDTGYLQARLNVGAQFKELRETIVDAWNKGKKDLVGLSINAYGKLKKSLREAGKSVAQSITKVSSVDLIVDPAAGGALVRMVEATDPQESPAMKAAMQAKIKAKFPNVDVEKLTDDEILAKYSEAIAADAPLPKGDKAGEPMTRQEFDAAMQLVGLREAARAKIQASGLPTPAVSKLLDWVNRQDNARLTEAEVDTTIKSEREYLARFTESGHVQLGGLDDVTVEDRAKKMADMLDAFFDPQHKDHRTNTSFKECYIEMTGDRRVTGRLENCDPRRMRESLGLMRESLDSTSWANVLGTALRRTMVADYRRPNQYDVWRPLVNVVPVSDFRTNERTRFGGYGDLPTVAQGAGYLALTSPTDEKATYAIAKKGGTEDVTLEMIRNDDVGAIRQIPIKLSRAAKRTLAKFVLDLIRTNPTVYDSVAFFHASHGNLGSAALDATSLAARRLAMLKQAEGDSADRLGIGPKYLIVPVDLEESAQNLFSRNTNNDKTFVNNLSLTVLPVWYWTDTNDWALGADPMELPSIEVGFLDGNEEPELFVQDNPTVGSMFTNDKVTWKIRFPFGGNVVNFRGFDKSVVA